MNFADRIKEQAQARDTSAKQITFEEFKEAIKVVSKEIFEEYDRAAAVVTTGLAFCSEMQKFMFEGKEKCTEEEYARAINYAFEEVSMKLSAPADILAPMAGAIFAKKAANILFERQED